MMQSTTSNTSYQTAHPVARHGFGITTELSCGMNNPDDSTRKPTPEQPGALPSASVSGSAATCEFLVAWKKCGKPATHYRQIISLSVIKGQKHEFRPPREHYCAKHYRLAEKWCKTDKTQFRYEMGELPPNGQAH